MEHFDKVKCDSVSVTIQRALQTILTVFLPRYQESWPEKKYEVKLLMFIIN